MSSLSEDLRAALGLALGLPAGQLDSLFEPEPHWQLKLTHYPPATAAADSGAIGVGAHTDSGFLTLLLQDDVGGLQAHTGGEWVDVPPAGPDVLVCNIGECAQMASGGYLLATPHRVLSSASSRISVPYFCNPALSATVRNFAVSESLPWERDDQAAEQARWRTSANARLAEYGANAFKSLARSPGRHGGAPSRPGGPPRRASRAAQRCAQLSDDGKRGKIRDEHVRTQHVGKPTKKSCRQDN